MQIVRATRNIPAGSEIVFLAPGLCKKAEEYAKVTYKICIGEDDTFDETYGKLAHQAMFEGIDLGEAFQSMAFMR